MDHTEKRKRINISEPFIENEEIEHISKVIYSGILAQGSNLKEFEEKFAKYIGTRFAVATSNGTTALHTALLSSGITQGDEVITTPFSFIASANSVLYVGAKPVFADINYEDFNINPKLISEKVNGKTKAILIVNLFGCPCELNEIIDICVKYNLLLIEDSCQAHGAEYKNKKVGSFGAAGCFSFYPTKNITTGEGGIITTNDKKIADLARLLINHGSRERYNHEILGYNFRMSEIEAAMGIEQLKKIDSFNKKRQENAEYLSEGLKNIKGIKTPKMPKDKVHVFNQHTIRIMDSCSFTREELTAELNKENIGWGIYYPIPIHKQKLYLNLGYKEYLPIAEETSRQVLSLPVHPRLSINDLDRIINVFKIISN
jgi:dTDP-4-amino-4,6-dideoxygalactose transaminase